MGPQLREKAQASRSLKTALTWSFSLSSWPLESSEFMLWEDSQSWHHFSLPLTSFSIPSPLSLSPHFQPHSPAPKHFTFWVSVLLFPHCQRWACLKVFEETRHSISGIERKSQARRHGRILTQEDQAPFLRGLQMWTEENTVNIPPEPNTHSSIALQDRSRTTSQIKPQ